VLQEEIDCGVVVTSEQARAFLLGWWESEQEGPADD